MIEFLHDRERFERRLIKIETFRKAMRRRETKKNRHTIRSLVPVWLCHFASIPTTPGRKITDKWILINTDRQTNINK